MTFCAVVSLLRGALWRLHTNTIMQVIKELSFVWARQQQKKGISCYTGSTESTRKSALIFRMWRSQGRFREPESSSSSQVRSGDTFTVSTFARKCRKRRAEGRGFPLSETQNDSSLELQGALAIPCSPAHHYQRAVEFLRRQRLCVSVHGCVNR